MMRSSRVWMRSSRVVRASDSQCRSRNSPASSNTVESERRQMKQCWISYIKKINPKKSPFNLSGSVIQTTDPVRIVGKFTDLETLVCCQKNIVCVTKSRNFFSLFFTSYLAYLWKLENVFFLWILLFAATLAKKVNNFNGNFLVISRKIATERFFREIVIL